MKRRRAESLTGGTGDVNPQWLSIVATESAADTTTTVQQTLPIQRLRTQGKAQVMEILKVAWFFPSSGEIDSSISAFLSTTSFGTTATTFSEPRVLDGRQAEALLTTSGTFKREEPVFHDLTDGAGHGILVATDSIFIQVQSAATSSAVPVRLKILYRFKDVSVEEYIGIVQSQQ